MANVRLKRTQNGEERLAENEMKTLRASPFWVRLKEGLGGAAGQEKNWISSSEMAE